MVDEKIASVHSLCIHCLAVLDMLERLIHTRDVQSTYGFCAGCGRRHCKTYRFDILRRGAA
jgi:hypothetical protein